MTTATATIPPSRVTRPRAQGPDSVVPVRAERLDRLVEAIGDLLVAESSLSRSEDLLRDRIPAGLAEDLENLSRICGRLRKIGTSLGLIPVEPFLNEMKEFASRQALRRGQAVSLAVEAGQAELDQRLVAKLREPLERILTHCLEAGCPAEGKPAQACLALRAVSRLDHLTIEIQDDGCVKDEDVLADPQIRRAVEGMQGTISGMADPDRGCRFILRLPVNPNLTDGLVVRSGAENCILPAYLVLRLIKPEKNNPPSAGQRAGTICFENEMLPLVNLNELFGQAERDLDHATVVVVEAEGRRLGLLVEELLGYEPIVVKKLNQAGRSTLPAAGVAVTADGHLAQVLDVFRLARTTLSRVSAEAGLATAGLGHSDGG